MASSVFFVALAAPEVKMTDLGERYHNPNFVDDIATVADALVLVCAAARRSLRDRISKQSTLSVVARCDTKLAPGWRPSRG